MRWGPDLAGKDCEDRWGSCLQYNPGTISFKDSTTIKLTNLTKKNEVRMKIKDLLAYEAIDVQASASSKEEIINKAIDLMVKSGKIDDRKAYAKDRQKNKFLVYAFAGIAS